MTSSSLPLNIVRRLLCVGTWAFASRAIVAVVLHTIQMKICNIWHAIKRDYYCAQSYLQLCTEQYSFFLLRRIIFMSLFYLTVYIRSVRYFGRCFHRGRVSHKLSNEQGKHYVCVCVCAAHCFMNGPMLSSI